MNTSVRARGACLQMPRLLWPLLGLGMVLSATLATFLINLIFHFPSIIYACASLATLLTGIPLWWFLIVRSAHPTSGHARITGILISMSALSLMWVIVAIGSCVSPLFYILWGQPFNASTMIAFIVLGPIFAGWVLIPIGACTGMLLFFLQNVLLRLVDTQK